MKNNFKFLYILIPIFLITVFSSCKKEQITEEQHQQATTNEWLQVVAMQHQGNELIIQTKKGQFQTGYNAIQIIIKDGNGNAVTDASPIWNPVMQMTSMSHSCPYSSITPKAGEAGVYQGFIIFQMPGNDMEHWRLNLQYTVNGNTFMMDETIDVVQTQHRVVNSFMASDNKRYVLAMVEPTRPKATSNTMSAALYRMENMMSFLPVEGYKIKIDPRMPGMGNHGSPNNVDLTHANDGFYHGVLNFTMTGYWKINLQLENNEGTIIHGEEVTSSHEASSIYFEAEAVYN